MDKFTRTYIECALWSSTDDGEPLDRYGITDIAEETRAKMIADCERFQKENSETLAQAEYRHPDFSDEEMAGRDFWLTRNHHGAGFWDGDIPESTAERLTAAAHAFGNFDMYIGDDGLIYGT